MKRRIATLTVLIALAGLGRARADLITYTESITTDGDLGGTAFSGKLVTLTLTADTSNASFFQGNGYTEYSNSISKATVTVAGVGTATLSDSFHVAVYVYSTFGEFAATDVTQSDDIFDTYASAAGFAGVDLKHSFGPVSGGAAYSTGTTFATTAGSFQFTYNGGGVSSVSGVVPAPPSVLLAGLGSICLLAARGLGRLRRA